MEYKQLAGVLDDVRMALQRLREQLQSTESALGRTGRRELDLAAASLGHGLEVLNVAQKEMSHWKTRQALEVLSQDLSGLLKRLAALHAADMAARLEVRAEPGALERSLRVARDFGVEDLLRYETRLLEMSRRYGTAEGFSPDKPVPRMMFARKVVEPLPPPTAMGRLVPVMFATDRAMVVEEGSARPAFLDGRGRELITYGVAEVSIPESHKRGKIERPSFWKLEFREDPEKHVVVASCVSVDLASWQGIARQRMHDAGSKAALVFVHGFNVQFDEAIRQAAQIGFDIQFHGLISAFSWGSEGKLLGYLADDAAAQLAARRLAAYLIMLKQQVGVDSVHLIAHSMGNLVLLKALQAVALESQPLLEQVILAAPDVDAGLFKEAVADLKGKAVRYTLYGSEHDKALSASKAARIGYARAGDGGRNVLVVDGVETVDASAVGEDLLGTPRTGRAPRGAARPPSVLAVCALRPRVELTARAH
jgi:esterase/lipase superfamily enzyme